MLFFGSIIKYYLRVIINYKLFDQIKCNLSAKVWKPFVCNFSIKI